VYWYGQLVNRPETFFAKVWNQHQISDLGNGMALIAIDRIFLHERTGSVALKSLAAADRKVVAPERVFCTMDHIVDTHIGRTGTKVPGGDGFLSETRAATQAAGIRLFDVNDPDQGIVHVISPELGLVLPGLTLVCPDSHTCSQGALGAWAWGIGSSEAEHALATNCLRVVRPKTMQVQIEGQLANGVTPKDINLDLIARFGADGASGYAVEYSGATVRAMDIEGRLTLCNMATEFAAHSGFVVPDETTFDYLHGRCYAPQGDGWDQAVQQWRSLTSDVDAAYDSVLSLEASSIEPMISWGTSPAHSIAINSAVPQQADKAALAYMGLDAGQSLIGTPIDAAFIGSCTNSRLSDLRRAAALIKGRKVAAGVSAICVPGSRGVKRAAELEGLHHIFEAAGFSWRDSGCSLCFYAGGEGFAPGARVVSSTNRNFEGRQGPKVRTHIASPETVVASALAGAIADPRKL
jgi:3-isopropylmalate/(R)-2-methylmalate dehydratase large subunit